MAEERAIWKFARDAALTIIGGLVIEPTLHRLHFDAGPYLPQIWFSICAFLTMDALWRSKGAADWSRRKYKSLNRRERLMSYVIVAILGAVLFSVYWLSITRLVGDSSEIDDKEFVGTVVAWGIEPLPSGPGGEAYEDVNTEKLLRFKDAYRLMLVSRVRDTTINWLEDPNIDKSAIFSIADLAGTVRITVLLSQASLHRAQALRTGQFDFYLCLVPDHVSPDAITTLADVAKQKGHVFSPAHGGGALLGTSVPGQP